MAHLLELELPVTNDFDIVLELRTMPEICPSLLVAVTDEDNVDVGEIATHAGFDCHLVKPIDLSKLSGLLYVAYGFDDPQQRISPMNREQRRMQPANILQEPDGK